MTSSQSETSADFDWVFPYEVLWPGYRKRSVTLVDLALNTDEYRTLNSTVTFFEPDAPSITTKQVRKFGASLDIGRKRRTKFTKNIWLISCFYLAQEHANILGHDRAAVSALLAKIAEAANTLGDLLGRLPPKVDAAMFYLRRIEPGAVLPHGPPFLTANSETHDLALVARRMAADVTAGGGRPAEFVRDAAIELLLIELHRAGVYDLRISDGNKRRGPHLAGKSGEFLTCLFRHIAPDLPDEYWIPKIKPIRTKVSRMQAGARMRQKT